MTKENSIVLEWLGKIAMVALTGWAGWATSTLIRHDSEIAVLRYNVLKVTSIPELPALPQRPPKRETILAYPFLFQPKEPENEKILKPN